MRRSLGAAATFLAATVVVFVITFALPGDPAQAIAGHRRVPESTLQAIRARYHLDDPLPVQYVTWLGRLLRGDLGESYVSRRPVADIMLEALPVTLTLLAVTIAIEIIGGLLIGTAAGTRRGRKIDGASLALCTIAIAAPVFLVAALAQDWFAVRMGLLPVAGTSDGLRSYVLPALVLALPGLAIAVRLMRSETIGVLGEPFVRTARGKGLSEGAVTRRHVVRCALVPFVAFIGLEIGALVGGSIIVERVFNLAGVGRALARAISQRDNALIIGFTMAIIAAYLIVDLAVDVAMRILDPRIGATV